MKPQLTIEAFADWCEKQPAGRAYDYYTTTECALAQYAASLGMITPYGPYPSPIHTSPFWNSANEAAWAFNLEAEWTFGALASRLRAQA